MAILTPHQLTLLADHIKLSLLERQRAQSLSLPSNTQDGEISRSLESFESSLTHHESASNSPDLFSLRQQYTDLYQQFNGTAPPRADLRPTNQTLKHDFDQATTQPNARRSIKSVRFTDNPDEEAQNRTALMPYSDEPDEDAAPDHSALSNQQIHQYHSQVIREQDDQLDVLGQSISRQRELSIQIGDELDDQGHMLNDMDEGVMRHQSQLDRGKTRLNKIARKAKENWSMLTIAILIVILLLLIIVLK